MTQINEVLSLKEKNNLPLKLEEKVGAVSEHGRETEEGCGGEHLKLVPPNRNRHGTGEVEERP